jgi:D-alanyl-D-alanine carboxypeptidase (penicillin-binding protein 5/6)
MGGSTLYLDQRDRPTVEQLIQGIVVQSGNDATVVVAEGLAGTEDAFARLMNDRAQSLGLDQSTFTNASGWPNPNHRMSARDLGMLSVRLIREFPEYYGYFAQKEYEFDGRAPQNRFNRNPLLDLGIGADGLKTGHTQEAGYGLVGSAEQGGRRIVFVLTGLQSERARAEESERVVSWAFRQFVEKTVAEEGRRFGEAPVWLGERQSVGLMAGRDLSILVPATQPGDLEARVVYRGPLEAPIVEGQEIAELVVPRDDLPEARLPLVADRSVPEGGFFPRVRTAAFVLANRAWGEAQALR